MLTTDHHAHDMKATSFPSGSRETRMDMEPSLSEGSSDDVQFTNIRPFYKPERLNNDLQVRRLICVNESAWILFVGYLSSYSRTSSFPLKGFVLKIGLKIFLFYLACPPES